PQWRIVAFADHASNGNLGYRNPSVNHIGLLVGSKFGPPLRRAAAPISSFSWAGTFAGLNAGIAVGQYNFVIFDPGAAGEARNASAGSLNIGGQLGHNWMLGALLMGFEGDFSAQHATSSFVRFKPIWEGISTTVYWLATARVRIGLDIQQPFLVKRF